MSALADVVGERTLHEQIVDSRFELIENAGHAKGDVLGIARTAGIMAAKRTAELIPLCHPIALTGLEVLIAPTDFRSGQPLHDRPASGPSWINELYAQIRADLAAFPPE